MKKMKMFNRRTMLLLVLTVFSVMLLAGCHKTSTDPGKETPDPEGTVKVYYKNQEGTELVTEKEQLDSELSLDDSASYLVARMVDSASEKMQSVFSSEQSFSYVHVDSNVAYVHFNSYRLREDNADEILCRAALTFTLTQLEGVNYVYLMVGEQQPVLNRAQSPVGFLSPTDFVYVVGRNVNNYKESQITLYFCTTLEDGTQMLTPEILDVSYAEDTAAFSIERYIVKKLIDGPQVEGNQATINSSVRILSVTVIDGICYVNLDGTFLKEPAGVDPNITIYSIVDSLTELSHINSVQIMVNGSSDGSYKSVVPLSQPFERGEEYLPEENRHSITITGWRVTNPNEKNPVFEEIKFSAHDMTETEEKTETETETEKQGKNESESGSETESGTETETETETGSETETETGSETETETGSETETETRSETETESEVGTEKETGTGSESETESETETRGGN